MIHCTTAQTVTIDVNPREVTINAAERTINGRTEPTGSIDFISTKDWEEVDSDAFIAVQLFFGSIHTVAVGEFNLTSAQLRELGSALIALAGDV